MSDRASVTVRVAAPREIAWDVFTGELDLWWRHGRKFRMGAPSTMWLESGVGGRLCERWGAAGAETEREIGVVTAWEPPRRLVIAWRAANFEPSDPSTEVEVTFERAIGHAGEGTLVTVAHRGWARIRDDHPVRHGEAPSAFVRRMGLWWSDLASSLRERIATRG